MTIDLWMLFATIVLALVQIGLQSTFYKRQAGHAYTIGPRDEPVPATGLAGRFARALANLNESLPLFAAAVLMAHVTGKANDWTAAAAIVFVVARIAYLGAYAGAIRHVRTALWQISMLAIVAMLVVLVP